MAPAYVWADFVGACRKGNIVLEDGVLDSARSYFGLSTKSALLALIVRGLENLEFLEPSYALASWKLAPPAPLVDGYKFTSGPSKKGYLAFYRSPLTQGWFLKSFHKDDPKHYRNAPTQSLGDLLDEAMKKRKKGEHSNG